MKVTISEGDRNRIMKDLVTFVKDHNILKGKKYDINIDKFMKRAEKQLLEHKDKKGKVVAVEMLDKTETLDNKPCLFPFEITSISAKSMKCKYMN